MRIPRPCLDCAELTTNPSRCDDCHREVENRRARTDYALDGRRTRLPGHDDKAWRALSKRARKAQPWCSHCGADDDLTTDHTSEAWDKYYSGERLTLEDVDVLCRSCNSRKGTSRGKWISEQ